MARKLRLEYEGAVYHVISRGNDRRDVFRSERARETFLQCLGQAAEKAGWIIHAWCVMPNHYHLCIETPQANLVAGMKWLQATFCVRSNRFRNKRGAVFQGRYKALLVEGPRTGVVCHYIHLNPVRVGLISIEALPQCKWTSLASIYSIKDRMSRFSPVAALQHAGGLADTAAGRKRYLTYLKELQEDDEAQQELNFTRISKDWAFGTRDFKLQLLKEHKELNASTEAGEADPRALNEAQWEKRVKALLRTSGKSARDIESNAKGAAWKVAIAGEMKQHTTATNPWLAKRLGMGSPFRLSRLTSEARAQPSRLTSLFKPTSKSKV